jgi:hypothetical protein
MLKCWELSPQTRPTFSLLVQSLSKFLENIVGYADIGNFMRVKHMDTSGDTANDDNEPNVSSDKK